METAIISFVVALVFIALIMVVMVCCSKESRLTIHHFRPENFRTYEDCKKNLPPSMKDFIKMHPQHHKKSKKGASE